MTRQPIFRRLITTLLTAAMLFAALPGAVFASGEQAYTRIRTMAELTSGQYVLVASDGYGLLAYSGGESPWVTAAIPTVEGDTVTDPMGAVWTLTVTDSGVILQDSGGVCIAPGKDGENGVTSGEYLWHVSCADGVFSFHGVSGDGAVTLAKNGEQGFRAYLDMLVAGYPEGYPSSFTLYRLSEQSDQPAGFTISCQGKAAVGNTLTFSAEPSLEGIVYSVRLDGGGWEELEANSYTVPEGQPGEHTLEIRASAGGRENTLILTYTIEKTAAISDGSYVIWDTEEWKALSTRRSYTGSAYFAAVSVTAFDGAPSGYTDSEIWTVTAADGALTIAAGSETLGSWTAEAAEGGWYLKNSVTGQYLRYDPGFKVWIFCKEAEEASLLRFDPAEKTGEQEVTGAVTISPGGGEIFVQDEEIPITLTCQTAGASIYFATSADGEVYEAFSLYETPILLKAGFQKLYVKAYAVKEGSLPSGETVCVFTERTVSGEGLYFGQLHAHSDISDGTDAVEALFEEAHREGLDFFAVTDHSNSFDSAGSGSIGIDGAAVSGDWASGKQAAQAATDWDFVGIYGYEMTWQEGKGLGHLNTFATPGFQSREQEAFSSAETALPNYYDALTTVPDSISQFNHPGTEYGDFQDFDHYSESRDEVIYLLEVGTGADAYLYYNRALDKGWHVAPVNYQDDHDGISEGRTAVYADSLTEEGIYDALRNYRVYATEDQDLSVSYTLDGYPMGTLLERRDVGDTVEIRVALHDPTDNAGAEIAVIADGGTVIARAEVTSETAVFSLSPEYSYYYIRVTQSDGDAAVTAPVWIDNTFDVGITGFRADTAVPVQGQELNLTLTLSNNERSALQVTSMEFSVGGSVIHSAQPFTLGAKDQTSYTFAYTHSGLGNAEIIATVTGTLEGVTQAWQETLTLSFRQSQQVTRILVDNTHGNAGTDSVERLALLAAENQILVTTVNDELTKQLLDSCRVLIVSAPSVSFEEDFLSNVSDFVKNGGSLVVCGQTDAQDSGLHSSAQLNRLLEAVGVTLRVRDDEARDGENNGGKETLLYAANFNTASRWCANVTSDQVYRQNKGCTVDPGSGTWLVKGYQTTYSVDSDGDGGGVSKGEAILLACEETAYGGTVFAAGGMFLGNTEIAQPRNIWDAPYANRTIVQNLLGVSQAQLPLSGIQAVRSGTAGEVYRVRGYVTAGTSKPGNIFPDTIYLQDETGGIAVTPFTQDGIQLGTPMDVVGYLDTQNGNPVLEVISWEVLEADFYSYEAKTASFAKIMDPSRYGSQLVQVEGMVVSVTRSESGVVSEFVLKDQNDDFATVLIEDCIVSGSTGKNELASEIRAGRNVRAIGILYTRANGTEAVRVRNCDEVVYVPPTSYTADKSNPKTGDWGILFSAAAMAAALTALAVLKKKRRI